MWTSRIITNYRLTQFYLHLQQVLSKSTPDSHLLMKPMTDPVTSVVH